MDHVIVTLKYSEATENKKNTMCSPCPEWTEQKTIVSITVRRI